MFIFMGMAGVSENVLLVVLALSCATLLMSALMVNAVMTGSPDWTRSGVAKMMLAAGLMAAEVIFVLPTGFIPGLLQLGVSVIALAVVVAGLLVLCISDRDWALGHLAGGVVANK